MRGDSRERPDEVTTYVANVGRRDAWQREYRFGVLLIYPPDPPLLQVNALRAKYDPRSQSACDAHISLTIPLPRPPTGGQCLELESIASGIATTILWETWGDRVLPGVATVYPALLVSVTALIGGSLLSSPPYPDGRTSRNAASASLR